MYLSSKGFFSPDSVRKPKSHCIPGAIQGIDIHAYPASIPTFHVNLVCTLFLHRGKYKTFRARENVECPRCSDAVI
jgi:hypothetical protein